jgi:hypothetical protein
MRVAADEELIAVERVDVIDVIDDESGPALEAPALTEPSQPQPDA